MTCTQPKNSPPAGAVDPAFVSRLQKRDKLRSIILWSVVIASSVAFGAMWRNPQAADAQDKPNSSSGGYAQAYLDLAEAELAYAEQMNHQSAGTFTSPQIAEFRKAVEIAKTMLKLEKERGDYNRMAALTRWAQLRLANAQGELERAVLLNRRVPGSVSDDRIKELKAYETLARLDAEAAPDAAAPPSADNDLQWRVTVLENEVRRLSKQVSLLQQLEQ